MLALDQRFQMDLGTLTLEGALAAVAETRGVSPRVREYAAALVKGVTDHLPELDRLLQEHLHRWRLDRLQRMDREILRLAALELTHPPREVPPVVAVSEAVALARRYGGPTSSRFVNGVADSLRRSLHPASR